MGATITNLDQTLPDDPVGAFCRENHVALRGSGTGPLAGLTMGVKDIFHIAGHRTGFGNPDWLRTHPPESETAPVVKLLLNAGANMVARTITDEFAYSLSGENIHYGTPINCNAPDRVPGGSSSGSAAAVTAGLVDIGLGTDCGGSVRLPSSYCGIMGIRPTHGRIPLDGIVPFAASFDVVGWFARDADLLARVGRVLMQDNEPVVTPRRLLVAQDAFALVDRHVTDALKSAVDLLGREFAEVQPIMVSQDGLDTWMEIFRTIQGSEIWANRGPWLEEIRPHISRAISERFAWASLLQPAAVAKAREQQTAVLERLDALIGPGDVLCLPTSPRIAPQRGTEHHQLEVVYRYQAMCLLCISGLGGLPQINLPLATLEGCPLGLSIVGRRGSDLPLLDLAGAVMRRAAEEKVA